MKDSNISHHTKGEVKAVLYSWLVAKSNVCVIYKRVAKLKKIKKIAQYGIESYEKFFDDMTQKEVEMKNSMFKEISHELK